MSRAGEVLVVFAALAGVGAYIGSRFGVARRQRALERARQESRWKIAEHQKDGWLGVYVEHPWEGSRQIGRAKIDSDEFNYNIEEVRSRAREVLVAMNSKS